MKELKDIFKKGFDSEGRPRIVKTVEELKEGINEYFNSIIKTRFSGEEGNEEQETYFYKPSITGLAIHLGYATRQSIYDNSNRDIEFSYMIKKATTFIEQYHEEALDSKNVTGHIFALKNMGWTDKQEIETKDVTKEKDYSKLSVEDLKTLSDIEDKLNE